jgi:hypothetical protein
MPQRRRPPAKLFEEPGQIEVGIGKFGIQLQSTAVRLQ